ncbi:MAG: hypothetical protein WDN48_20760 [Pseudolabrys sp.]
MELAQIFHAVVGVLFVALILGHIYLGTVGMEGAFETMADGNADLNWAKEHHALWVQDELSRTPGGQRRAAGHLDAGRIDGPIPMSRHNTRLHRWVFCYKGLMNPSMRIIASPAGAAPAKPR